MGFRKKSFDLQFLQQPSSKCGCFAYQDYSNEESDVKLGSSQQQLVVLPFVVHREVDTHLKAHLSEKSSSRGGLYDDSLHSSSSGGSVPADEGIYEKPEPSTRHSIIKKRILQRKRLQLLD